MPTYKFTRSNVDNTVHIVYEYIVEYIQKNGYSPSVRDLCAGVGIKSTSTIHSHLKRLESEGKIVYGSGKRRAITVPRLEAETPSNVKFLPIVGEITAGKPILATENIEQTFPLATDFLPDSDNMFILKVKGDSMINAAILNGDLVFIKKQNTAHKGDIIAALIYDEATIKTLTKNEKDEWILHPENPAYEDIPFNHEDCSIIGVVAGVFRSKM